MAIFKTTLISKSLERTVCAIALLVPILTAPAHSANQEQGKLPRCLYISSYHEGYAWSDGVEEGLRSTLDGKCQIRQLDMNTKKYKTLDHKEAAAKRAVDLIYYWKPDVVITSDDNAAKYVIVPHFKDSEIPFVFSGVNWTVEEYGFPYSNVTGIVEVAPIDAMLKKAVTFSNGSKAVYIGADTLTEKKNYSRISDGAAELNLQMTSVLVSDFDQWLKAIVEAQSADFIVMGSNSGITGWDEKQAVEHTLLHTNKISVTNHVWMMSVTSLGFTKLPQEHGEWAAEAGLAILSGVSPTDIPIVKNRKWELWINNTLLDKANIELPVNFSRKAKRLASID